MKALRVAVTVLAAVLVVACIGCGVGGIWTDRTGRQDDISVHLWLTACILIAPAAFVGLFAAFFWGEEL